MLSAGIEAALQRNCRPLRQASIDCFIELGVPPLALARPQALGTANVVLIGNRFEFARYLPSNDAQPVIVVIALDQDGVGQDLVAWCPKTGAIGTWYGRAAMLGAENLFAARFDGPALPVHENAIEYLRASRWGVVPIDMRLAAPLLRDVGPLGAANLGHCKRLAKALVVPPPRILVAVPEDRRPA